MTKGTFFLIKEAMKMTLRTIEVINLCLKERESERSRDPDKEEVDG
jgi:hypothetical protein